MKHSAVRPKHQGPSALQIIAPHQPTTAGPQVIKPQVMLCERLQVLPFPSWQTISLGIPKRFHSGTVAPPVDCGFQIPPKTPAFPDNFARYPRSRQPNGCASETKIPPPGGGGCFPFVDWTLLNKRVARQIHSGSRTPIGGSPKKKKRQPRLSFQLYPEDLVEPETYSQKNNVQG